VLGNNYGFGYCPRIISVTSYQILRCTRYDINPITLANIGADIADTTKIADIDD